MCVYECLSSLLKVFVMKKHVLSVEFAVFKVELLCVKGIKEYSLTLLGSVAPGVTHAHNTH